MAEYLVDIKDVSRSYGEIRALKNISFQVSKGEVIGFLGPNGAGKTTTMQIITGNLAPSSGRITINGHDLLENPRAAKAAIGYLPEQPPVYRELTVDEYLDYCAALNRIPKAQRRQARETVKGRCGLGGVGRRLIGHLSKGYQQRVGLAQAVIHLPAVIILDEPTVGLDPIQIREIRELIRELGQDHAVILSTHILPEVQMTCDQVQIISQGELVMHDSIDGLQSQLKGASLTVAFRRPPPLSVIEQLVGVSSVQQEKDRYLRIFHHTDHDPTDELVRLAVQHDWGLYELRPGRVSLEDIFVQLTTQETSEDKEAAA